jgi:hypothetical protein
MRTVAVASTWFKLHQELAAFRHRRGAARDAATGNLDGVRRVR